MNPSKVAVLSMAGIMVVIALSIGLFLLGHEIRRWVAPIEGETGVTEFRESAENRIARYDSFFDQCASIRASEERLVSMMLTRDGYSVYSQEWSDWSRSIAGIDGLRIESITQYNADARKNYTGAEFRSSELPYQIYEGPFDPERKTECFVASE